MNSSRIKWNYGYHPLTTEQEHLAGRLREQYRAVAHVVNDGLSDIDEREFALTKLEESLFWALAALSRSKRPKEF